MTTIPDGARHLLDFIGKAETGRSGPDAYGIIVFHQQGRLSKPLTDFTIDELLAVQKVWAKTGWSINGKKRRGSAAGKYQIIRATMLGLVKDLGIPGSARFSPEMQDRLGMALLTRRGWQAYVSGQVSAGAFALALAKEWASMPVLSTVNGAHRKVIRGESYYAGDGVNKSQAKAAELEAILEAIRTPKAVPEPAPVTPPEPAPAPERPARDPEQASRARGIVGIIIIAATAIAAAVSVLWENVSGFIGGLF